MKSLDCEVRVARGTDFLPKEGLAPLLSYRYKDPSAAGSEERSIGTVDAASESPAGLMSWLGYRDDFATRVCRSYDAPAFVEKIVLEIESEGVAGSACRDFGSSAV